MNTELKEFLETKDNVEKITLTDILEIFKRVRKDTQVVIEHTTQSFVMTDDTIEIGETNGEWFHTIAHKDNDSIGVVEAMSDYLKDVFVNWEGNLKELCYNGYNAPHPLYKPCDNMRGVLKETLDIIPEVSPYQRVCDKIKKHTGIDTISVTVQPYEFIVDDTSIPKCLCHVVNMYNAHNIVAGSMSDVGITCSDLEELHVLEPILYASAHHDVAKHLKVKGEKDGED